VHILASISSSDYIAQNGAMTSAFYVGNNVKRCDHITGGYTRVAIAIWNLGVSTTELRKVGPSFKN